MTQNAPTISGTKKWAKFAFLLVFVQLTASCGMGYVLSSSYHQMALLWSRVPVEDARASGKLSASQLSALDIIADVRSFGAELGLSSTENYTAIALDWDRTIWNVSGCEPDAFSPKTWWFPLVGRVPYLGFFHEDDVREKADELAADGMDVYVRKVAAYSTLGWFEDPILVPMLSWGQLDIARLILHELTHTTLWLPSDVSFNESFANFVGNVAGERYMAARHGIDGEPYRHALRRRADRKLWRSLLHGVYQDLDAIYRKEDLDVAGRLASKGRVFDTLSERVGKAAFSNPAPYLRSVREGTWNNARMVQFRAYNQDDELFAEVLNAMGGDIVAMIFKVGELVDGADDPRQALRDFSASRAASSL